MPIEQDTDSRERADLVETMARHRSFLRHTVKGLSDEEAARRTTVSELCLGGLIKHVAFVEKGWTEFIERGPAAMALPDEASMEDYAAGFRMLPGETLAGLPVGEPAGGEPQEVPVLGQRREQVGALTAGRGRACLGGGGAAGDRVVVGHGPRLSWIRSRP